MKTVDLRSDTITKPSPEMWEKVKAMDNSDLGDNVLGEDPTVNQLEQRAAELVGKEDALFVSSGTQGNLLSVLSHTSPGDEILAEEECHIYKDEVGNVARIGGVMLRTYPSKNGIPDLNVLQSLIRNKEDIHEPPTTLLCTENTHNFHGGVPIPPKELEKMKEFAEKNELKFHMDGARLFNAAVALNLPATEFTRYVDSVMFCLSKGLSCPIGSIVAGDSDFLQRAKKFRKMMGGGWRQAGIIAMFGLVALQEEWIQRLEEDHRTNHALYEGIKGHPLITVDEPQTNILMVKFPKDAPMSKIIQSLRDEGILAFSMGQRIRFVTHYGISMKDIDYAVQKLNLVFSRLEA
ncbi:MAG: threonine aldolase family protein [Promethearchaeia archaeon]